MEIGRGSRSRVGGFLNIMSQVWLGCSAFDKKSRFALFTGMYTICALIVQCSALPTPAPLSRIPDFRSVVPRISLLSVEIQSDARFHLSMVSWRRWFRDLVYSRLRLHSPKSGLFLFTAIAAASDVAVTYILGSFSFPRSVCDEAAFPSFVIILKSSSFVFNE